MIVSFEIVDGKVYMEGYSLFVNVFVLYLYLYLYYVYFCLLFVFYCDASQDDEVYMAEQV